MVTQLRDYRITDGGLEQFVEEWRTQLAPIRRGLGFTIDGAWTVEEDGRFLWLLTFPGDWHAFEEADARYFASPERQGFDPDPARLIEAQGSVRLTEVERP